ncbi:cytochrome ubiquinol oxidase subunit I [Nocardioides sp. zg-536]|uniref:Cytochrome ubiquinol oxidase subunit I n=1 Tax=Nocardioides faecalis TaxID=2803858 RepID=A0A938Y6F8_9ACTN|nr:cytochrome ubiquinol oxidase subunit I [Nocardioides faecalis]MBM9460087.1 cytochrome ubiquinol oxidase subunit I [Nocardioides faecalis]MBS4754186.1 cytochrome ubiquinol oxidase subunit I [Nocardioides faecalis]QVI60116.1 cytochrome ubiquinol oxidase subunit I [Nocardioides faecalis]
MEVVDIARWQFGIITAYHFLFVPITIGLSALIAVFETLWLVKKDEAWLRLTKFFGKLFLINFAIGVVTGIVQEFQFGMNWSDYSRFVGDVFGAPLAIEGLLAFFLESTFLGLWIFGWDKLPRALHAGCMWLVHIGTLASAYFILAANSWMQHPVGHTYNAETGRAELTDFGAVMFNKVQLVAFPHVVTACYMTAGAFVLGVCAFLYLRNRRAADAAEAAAERAGEAVTVTAAGTVAGAGTDTLDGTGTGADEGAKGGTAVGVAESRRRDAELYRKGLRLGAVITLIAGLAVAITGDLQGKVMTEVQPMKMAAAEGLYETSDKCAPFSILTLGTPDGKEEKFAITVPCLLSFLGTGSFDGTVEGINPLREKYEKEYGTDPGAAYYTVDDYVPVIPIAYWSFRFMMGLGVAAAVLAGALLWLTRRGRAPTSRWWSVLALGTPVMVVFASTAGWIFTEMGRQPWVVYGLMTTENAVSPGVSLTEAWISLIALVSIYAVLAVVEIGLLVRYVKKGAEPFAEPPNPGKDTDTDDDAPLAFAY